MINQSKKCVRMCGVNVANVFVVGLLSGLIGVGVAYFVLIRSADFQWWWLIVLFGTQFLSVIVVAYALKKTLSLNNMFCETPALVSNYDWSSLRTAPIAAPTLIHSDGVSPVDDGFVTNSADWQDLLLQLDQMEKVPAAALKNQISDVVCPPVVPIVVQPAPPPSPSTFDFSTIASALTAPATAPVVPITVTVSSPMPAKAIPVTLPSIPAAVVPPVLPSQPPAQGIDFAALFR